MEILHLQVANVLQTLGSGILELALAEDEGTLEDQSDSSSNAQGNRDHEDLDVELQETATSLPVKALPGIDKSEHTTATILFRNDLAVESAVNRDDSILVLGEKAGLDAGEGNGGGEDDEERNEDVDAHGEERLGDDLGHRAIGLSDGQHAQAESDVGQSQIGTADSSAGSKERLVRRTRKDARPHRLLLSGRRGDDRMGPASVDGRKKDGGNQDRESRERDHNVQDDVDDGVQDRVDQEHPESTPASESTALGNDMLDGGPDPVGDGDGRALGWDRIGRVGGLVERVGGVLGQSDGRHRGLDHGQSRNDLLKSVGELRNPSCQ
jgi:hypothetical protein